MGVLDDAEVAGDYVLASGVTVSSDGGDGHSRVWDSRVILFSGDSATLSGTTSKAVATHKQLPIGWPWAKGEYDL